MLKKSMLKTKQSIDYLNFEINCGRSLKHPHVLGIEFVIQRDFEIILVLKYLPGKDLQYQLDQKMIKDIHYMVPEPVIIFWAYQMLLGIKYLHSKKYVHRDFKLSNTLMSELCNIMICDFGMTTKLEKGQSLRDRCGTPHYMAPEQA